MVDPDNEVVKLCAAGIQAEMEGRHSEASRLYIQAWQQRTNDYEACIVAHYMARIQPDAAGMLHWNLEALAHADKVGDESVDAFYPSLYLNVGKAYEDLRDVLNARKYYELGDIKCSILPDNDLGNITRDAIRRGLTRVG